jgi:hypothetical protein
VYPGDHAEEHADAVPEGILVPLHDPAGATGFGLFSARAQQLPSPLLKNFPHILHADHKITKYAALTGESRQRQGSRIGYKP